MKKSLIAAALVVSLSAVAVACDDGGDATPEPDATPVVTEAPDAVETLAADAEDAVESIAADAEDAVESIAADAEDAVESLVPEE